ncbi:MAG TPA: hypothetical protein VGL07_14840 [Buttiauxella sp.]|jgi:hypothetical protein
MMQPAIIRITEVECGDENAPVSFAPLDAASVVHFETRSGESPVTVRGWIEALFQYAINPEYDPVSGDGRFLTLECVPDIASYETDV